jgi:ATP-dependent Clp protease protease subunit
MAACGRDAYLVSSGEMAAWRPRRTEGASGRLQVMMSLPPELQSALLGRRVVFLRGRLDEATANNVIAQLLLVAHTSPGGSIELYVDSPSGSVAAALSVYDVLQTSVTPVTTTCIGTCGGASVLVLAGGAAGRRFALPHARIHLQQDALDVPAGKPTQTTTQAEEAVRLQQRWQSALAQHISHSPTQLARDLISSRWLSAAEARDYGLVDGIIPGVPHSSGE